MADHFGMAVACVEVAEHDLDDFPEVVLEGGDVAGDEYAQHLLVLLVRSANIRLEPAEDDLTVDAADFAVRDDKLGRDHRDAERTDL